MLIKRAFIEHNKVHKLKELNDDVMSIDDDFFDQWDSSTATPMEEV